MERRSHDRTATCIDVEIRHLHGCCRGHIRDLGGCSMFVEIEGGNYPATGSLVQLNFGIDTGWCRISRQAGGEVARWDELGVAIRFDTGDGISCAVIEEILYYQQTAQRQDRPLTATDAA
ncbi:hypothetical protein TspCOW1_08010 [Thiohalobacter sp. COW1]|uniref:L-aminopeptidase/D-esterase n=1 Tax=Thiohalobacter thiocyanaticus TaxID=585455 RepID=A0A1Z4VRI7_9GAMM|nr:MULTISPECIES: PilZ domain-containing protein [Thiohalobacter]BAZ94237.1 L-aminopeptidase/D-esterase [Thiohalobacter thiocyanaticus]BCO30698.1 hypothetical protein TspCOW1_08010 [Thiohalobacter sp. COW1]